MRPANFQGNIHIINIPISASAADLAALFDDFGIVIGAQIKIINAPGGPMRMGIVSVAPDKAADKAIEALQGYELHGLKLKLRKAEPQVRTPKAPKAPKAAAKPDRPRLTAPDATAYPAMQREPRKVIVEYRGRRPLSRA